MTKLTFVYHECTNTIITSPLALLVAEWDGDRWTTAHCDWRVPMSMFCRIADALRNHDIKHGEAYKLMAAITPYECDEMLL